MKMNLSIIVAASLNHCIGKDNDLPWRLSADLKKFKSLTMGHSIIMGRKTFELTLTQGPEAQFADKRKFVFSSTRAEKSRLGNRFAFACGSCSRCASLAAADCRKMG